MFQTLCVGIYLVAGKRAKWLDVAACTISVAFSVPILFFFNLHETEGNSYWIDLGCVMFNDQLDYGTQCWIDFPAQWHWQLYMILVALSLFIFPALIIASCYTLIVVTIWKKSKIMQPPLCTSAILPRGNIRIIPSINKPKILKSIQFHWLKQDGKESPLKMLRQEEPARGVLYQKPKWKP